MVTKLIVVVLILFQVFGSLNAESWGSTFIGETRPNSLVLYDERFQLPGVPGEVLKVDKNITFDLPIQAMRYAWSDGKIQILEGGMHKNFIIFTTQSSVAGGAINTSLTLYYNSAIQTSVSIILIALSVVVSLCYQI